MSFDEIIDLEFLTELPDQVAPDIDPHNTPVDMATRSTPAAGTAPVGIPTGATVADASRSAAAPDAYTPGSATIVAVAGAPAAENEFDALIVSARKQAGNGRVTLGFITNSDPGLKAAEYVVVPFGSALTDYDPVDKDYEDTDFGDAVIDCIFSDAARVATLSVPEELKGFVLANRAYSYACGWLGDAGEFVVADTQIDKDARRRYVGAHPFITEALTMNKQVATLGCFSCGTNYFLANHNTTGALLPKGQRKAVRTSLALPASITDVQITNAVYYAGHATDKRLILRSILARDLANALRAARALRRTRIADADAWAAPRIGANMLPAGCGTIGILKVLLSKVVDVGLGGFAPVPEAVRALAEATRTVETDPRPFHPGAAYLFDVDVTALAAVEDLKTYIGVFGSFCVAAKFCPSVVTAPHIAGMIADRANAQWTNMGRLFMKGVEVSEARVKAAAQAAGVAMGDAVPDPETEGADYKAYNDGVISALKGIHVGSISAGATY